MVVNPGDVPTKASEKARKNNRIDARKLARSLRSGDLHGIYVPSREAQEDRSLVRMRQSLVRKQTRVKNQIKSFLVFYGVKLPEDIGEKHWSRRFIEWIEALANKEGSASYALKVLIEELKNLRKMVLEVTKEIKILSGEDRYREDIVNIVSIPGYSTVSAMMIMTEIIDINRFKKLDEFRSYFGIVPGEHSTGEDETTTGLTRIRNKVLRGVVIEASWVAVRKDPALMLAFTELCKRMKKNEAIIRIAKKMVNRLWYVLKNKEPYQIGVVE